METVNKAKAKTPVKAAAEPAGFCVYIGPTIPGQLQNGSVYQGTRQEVLAALSGVLGRYPYAAPLVVSGDWLAEARGKARTPGNYLYTQARKLRNEIGG